MPQETIPALQIGDFVRVKSLDDKDWTFSWDSRPYVLPAGGEVLMPFECAALWFGDPRSGANVSTIRTSQGVVTWVGDRATEVRRLRTKYDNQFGDETIIDKAPKVEVYDLEDNRVYMVLDDPSGDQVTPAATTISDQAQLLAVVQRQERLIQTLMSQQGIQQDVDPAHLANAPGDATNPTGDQTFDDNGNIVEGDSPNPDEAPTLPGGDSPQPVGDIPEDGGPAV